MDDRLTVQAVVERAITHEICCIRFGVGRLHVCGMSVVEGGHMANTLALGPAPNGSDDTGTLLIEEPVLPVAPVGGPVWRAWREGTLTRAKELESQAAWMLAGQAAAKSDPLASSIPCHIAAARDAANGVKSKRWFAVFRNGSLL